MIIYAFAILDSYGIEHRLPVTAWFSAEQARAAAVSFLADRLVVNGEADEMLEWSEEPQSDGRYPTFTAPTKCGREVRVWPIEIIV